MSARRSSRSRTAVEHEAAKHAVVKEEAGVSECRVKDEKEKEVEQLDDYERIRHDNIQRNLQFLNSIGIQDVKSDMQVNQQSNNSNSNSSSKGSSRGLKRKAPEKAIALPPRRSGRVTIERLKKEIDDSVASGKVDASEIEQKRGVLESMVADKVASTYDASVGVDEYYPPSRLSSDPIPLLTPLNQPKTLEDDTSTDWGHGLLPLLSSDCTKSTPKLDVENDCSTYRKTASSLQVGESDVAKVVPQRITAITMHPSQDRTLVIAGDKQGTNAPQNQYDDVYHAIILPGCIRSHWLLEC
jgi:hypothetical protein